ncbi:MAG: MAPEG family protein [Rhodopseudomonas sp.]|uniref:MAPEG family protein n=1 Tax=Rhodopseudomonas sp. TaxID=1078 RepID=UPI00183CC3CD|nr:MAPEG family protein [Rhodopseudomonas sp.]NVN88637.1 MAPEG family protein [Rhodopseudomonas sp.]
MSVQMILLPVFVLVTLTLVLLLRSHFAQRKQGGSGGSGGAVDDVLFDPQQLAVLFYVLIAIALPLRHADLVIVLLSWVFVVTRFVHAGMFVTANGSGNRSMAYLAGALVLLAMWVYFALRILLLI